MQSHPNKSRQSSLLSDCCEQEGQSIIVLTLISSYLQNIARVERKAIKLNFSPSRIFYRFEIDQKVAQFAIQMNLTDILIAHVITLENGYQMVDGKHIVACVNSQGVMANLRRVEKDILLVLPICHVSLH